ncbi:hypothetical protein SAMN06297251_1281 [Fulvimarina manganoxydans]|uniref:Uncharacterized protein n=1 Tax=Fulvimarina manganoxydans TaxID=937218 RepID=A0A1W2ELC9_9HYPH|nr:hypothetical protein SAMN06297251_1281 [Fulvimarina manganoxydans]
MPDEGARLKEIGVKDWRSLCGLTRLVMLATTGSPFALAVGDYVTGLIAVRRELPI